MKKISIKNKEKRKEERKNFPDFYKKHIDIARESVCEECGTKLKGDVSEIAHVLPKSYFKSVMCDDENVLYLCGRFSINQCHGKFDNNPIYKIKEMKIYDKVKEVFSKLEDKITEKLTYKHYDLYQ